MGLIVMRLLEVASINEKHAALVAQLEIMLGDLESALASVGAS